MNIVFVCLNYRPAHKYVIDSYCDILRGNKLFFLICDKANYPEYQIPKECNKLSISDVCEFRDKLIFLFVSPSKFNYSVLMKIKKSSTKNRCVYLYHEPITNLSTILKDRGYRFKNLIYYFALRFLNGKRLVRHFDYVLLPSKNSNELYEKQKIFRLIPHKVQPLMYKNQKLDSTIKKKYFSYIGTVAKNHGFNQFIDFLLSDSVDSTLFCSIVTSSQLDKALLLKLQNKFKDHIFIQSGRYLSNDEMAFAYSQTKILWLGYTNSAQSGVLPMAMSFGTPVIFSNIHAFDEYLINHKHGVKVNINDNSEIHNAVKLITARFEYYSKNCLNLFNNSFSIDSQRKEVLSFFETVFSSI